MGCNSDIQRRAQSAPRSTASPPFQLSGFRVVAAAASRFFHHHAPH
jgi:hypothetical protein